MHGKQMLVAVSLYIFLNAFLSEAKLQLKIEMSKKEGICGKYVQDPKDKSLKITHAFLVTKGASNTANDYSTTNPIVCEGKKNDKDETEHLLWDCESNQVIEYRYNDKKMNLFGAMKQPDMWTGPFQHDGHLHIKKIRLLKDGNELPGFGFDKSECIEDSYPDNMIADHGLYTLEKKDVAKWVRVYFEPQAGEHIVLN